MDLPTLEEFITKRRFANSYVTEPGFDSLYVRMGKRWFNGVPVEDVLDLANLVAEKPGNGVFTRLVERLHARGIVLYVECVQQKRFAEKLLRMGFQPANAPDCYYKMGDEAMSTDWPPFDGAGVEDLGCPVCEEEGCVYVERKQYFPGEFVDAYCGECHALLVVDVVLEPQFGNPKVKT